MTLCENSDRSTKTNTNAMGSSKYVVNAKDWSLGIRKSPAQAFASIGNKK